MTLLRRSLLLAPLGAALALGTPALAQDDATAPSEQGDYVFIGSEIGGFDGVRHLNIAAGNKNQQANHAAIAAGDFAINTAIVSQSGDTEQAEAGRNYSAQIGADAFADSHGLTAINIVAGSGNQQANLALITTGLEGRVATSALLSQTRASSQPLGESDPAAAADYTARIDPSAFRDSSGIVQVSLIGGTGNTSANVAVLSVEAGAN